MLEKIKCHISVSPDILRDFRVLAAFHGVRQGNALAGLMAAFATLPLEVQVRAMAAADNQAGELVWEGTETAYIAQVKALAAVPARVDGGAF